MEVVLIFNGLGNQMSQYGFYMAKKNRINNTKFMFYSSDAAHNGYELENVFGIKKKNYFLLEIIFRIIFSEKKINIFIRRVFRKLRFVNFYIENSNYNYDGNMLNKGSCLINFYWGGWHSYKYYEEIEAKLKNQYSFRNEIIDPINIELSNRMRNEQSVSIHIRRGDYLNPKNKRWGSVITDSYYKNVINMLQSESESYQYYCFTDDIDWVKKNFNVKNIKIIDWNKGDKSWQDLFLISNCKINVNPNSTFSWWGAWLNIHKGRRIIVPDRFVIDNKSVDFYPETWIQIPMEENL